MIHRTLDLCTSRAFREIGWCVAVLAVALVACAISVAHSAEGLNVSAIAGHQATVAQSGPALDVGAIATSTCKCKGCKCTTPHQCGDPGCTCECGAKLELPALGLAAISPKRQPAVTVAAAKPAMPPPINESRAKAAPPHWEQRPVCNGGFCKWQWVLVQ